MANIDFESLLSNPMFMGGVSGLLAPSQDRAKAMLGGMQTAIAQKNAVQQQQINAMKIAAMEKQQAFNPQDYMQGSQPGNNAIQQANTQVDQQAMPATLGGVGGGMTPMQPGAAPQVQAPPPSTAANGGQLDLQGLLSGGLQAGYSPGEIAGISQIMDPVAAARAKLESQTGVVGPGATLVQGGKPVYTNTNAPPGGISQQITQLTQLRDAAAAKGDAANAKLFQTALDKVSGTMDAQQAADRMAETKSQHQFQQGIAQDRMDAQAGQREIQNAQKVQGQTSAFSNQIQKVGIPQAQQQLNVINNYLDKYKGKDLPGYNMIDSLKPDWLLDQPAQELRQAVQSFANVLLKTRSGAAVTEPEQRRFLTELGNGKLMPSDRLRQGMTMMQGLLDSEKRNAAAGVSQDVLDNYSQNGGDIDFSGFRGKAAPKSSSLGSMPVGEMSLEQLKALRAARKGQ